MNEDYIGFANKLSVGFLDVSSMELTRLDNVDQNHFIFTRIQTPFDWYYQNDIIIIPDPVPRARANWNKTVYVFDQEIECVGEFISFFHFEKIKEMNYVTSLSLPEFDYIKKGINIS